MSLISPAPRQNGPDRFTTKVILIVVFVCLLGLVSVGIMVAIALFHQYSKTSQYYQPPPAAPMYTGSDMLPAGLPPASTLFSPVITNSNPTLLTGAAAPPVMQDASLAASSALLVPVPEFPTLPSLPTPVGDPKRSGLIVCEPVASATTAPEIDSLGDAASEWLQIVAAGQPDICRSPLFEDYGRFQLELGRTDLRLAPAQAAELAGMTGANFVACATISGNTSSAKVTYQLFQLPTMAPLGHSIVVSGSADQISSSLPSIAVQLDTELGVKSPHLPTVGPISGADLSWLGTLVNEQYLGETQLLRLSNLSRRSPLAGELLLPTWATNDQIVLDRTITQLRAELPDNAETISDIGWQYPDELRSYASLDRALFSKFPNNALFAHTEVWEQRLWGSRLPELAAANRVAADSPYDPDSWLSPAETISEIAEDLRGGVYLSDISSASMRKLNALYQLGESERKESVILDPKFGRAWKEFGYDAMFAGDSEAAESAAKKAEALDSDGSQVDLWEMEMYQPKWYDHPTSLQSAANRATARNYGNDASTIIDIAAQLKDVSNEVGDSKYESMSEWVTKKGIDNLRTYTANNPYNAYGHWLLGQILASENDRSELREATKEYRIAEHFLPNCAEIHYELADILSDRNDAAGAIAEYRQAVAINPFFGLAEYKLGWAHLKQHDYTEAEQEIQCAVRYFPTNADMHYGLAELYFMERKFALASTQFKITVSMEPYYIEAWAGLSSTLDDAGKYQESIEAAQSVLSSDAKSSEVNTEAEVNAHDVEADDYINLKQWSASLDQTQQALSLNDSDPVGQENIAEAYWGQGKKEQAKEQWIHVASIGDAWASPLAKKYLAEHYGQSGTVTEQHKLD